MKKPKRTLMCQPTLLMSQLVMEALLLLQIQQTQPLLLIPLQLNLFKEEECIQTKELQSPTKIDFTD